ncbi:MAG TPA: hypothetical protein PJ982_17010, partial [Lacipirellulaceae bacterium]|nr:hypothetical protein [Lacipirellulaceae bacterium]
FGLLSQLKGVTVREMLIALAMLPPETRADLEALREAIANISVREVLDEITSEDGAGMFRRTNWQRFWTSPAGQFFFEVVVPCQVHCGAWPSAVLHKATRRDKPDFKLLDKLVRIDKRLVGHRRVAGLLRRGDYEFRKTMERDLGKAMQAAPPPLKRATVKTRVCQMIIRLGGHFGVAINAVMARDLLNAVADLNRGHLIDADLPPGAEAWSKSLQRERRFWDLPAVPDKEWTSFVRALGTSSF